MRDAMDVGRTTWITHEIELIPGAVPHKEPVRRLNPAKWAQAEKQIQELLEQGKIEPSKSPWGSGIVMVRKKTGNEMRMCVDFRNLNDVTIKDAYPLPRIDDALTYLGQARYFTTLDLAGAFWQVPLREKDREKRHL